MNNKEKRLRDLNLTDKFLFDETMEHKEAYEALVSILTEQDIMFKEKPETEKEFRVSPELREIRMDVIALDEKDALYYTEMQNSNTGNLLKRSRYYQAHLDVSLLQPGEKDFNKLNDSCMILIAPFDLFGKGLYRYTFEGVCRECPELKLNDGALRIFINTKGTNRHDFSQEFLELMEYLNNTSDEVAGRIKSKKIKIIHSSVEKIKMSERMGVKVMQKWEQLAYAKEYGHEYAVVSLLISQIIRKLQNGKTIDHIVTELKVEFEKDAAYINRLYNTMLEFAPDYDCEQISERFLEDEGFHFYDLI